MDTKATSDLVAIIDRYKELAQITDAEIARRMGISRQNLHLWRTRGMKSLPERATLESIAAGLEVSYKEILGAALADTGHIDALRDAAPDAVSGLHEEPQQMGSYAAILASRDAGTAAALCEPAVSYESVASPAPEVMHWRAHLQFTDADDPGLTVIGGYADFTTVRTPASVDLPELLRPSPFSLLFQAGELHPDVEAAFNEGPVLNVVLISDVFIDPALRGHQLGAWLAADIANRMSPTINGVVALCPLYVELSKESALVRLKEGLPLQRLVDYWRDSLHMEPYGDFLLIHTAFTTLGDARRALDDARRDLHAIAKNELFLRLHRRDEELWPIDTVISDARKALATAVGTIDRAIDAIGPASLLALEDVLDSVADDDAAEIRVATMISFRIEDDASEYATFYRAAEYLEEHPQLRVNAVLLREFLGQGGAPTCSLDLEVEAQASSASLSNRPTDDGGYSPEFVQSRLSEFPWVVWQVDLIDPNRTAGENVAKRTKRAATATARADGCMYEYCEEDDEILGVGKYYGWVIGVPQAKHRQQIGGIPTAVHNLIASLKRELHCDDPHAHQWRAEVVDYFTYVRNCVDHGY